MTLVLREYQRQAVDNLYDYWAREGGAPLIVVPTGGGKSLILATLMKELLEKYPDMRILCVSHVKELLVQSYQELLGIWPLAPAGLFSAGLGQRDSQSQIIFGGVQTIANKAASIGHVDLVIVDEAHLISRDSNTRYGKLFTDLRAINPDLMICGLTATDYRLGEGRLTEGDDAMFSAVAFEKSVGELIDEGFLCRPITKATVTGFDLTGVGRLGGDYKQGALQAAVDRADVTRRAVDEICGYGASRKSWLLFGAGVEHAMHIRDEIRGRGIGCETVTGETPSGERARILDDFKSGRLRAVTNNSVLTTGLNVPGIDLLAMLRPTLSTSLYVQMCGRGLRNAPAKQNCLVLDFAGNIRKHGPIDDVRVRPPGKGDGEVPIKECPNCHSLVHASKMTCDDCGFVFPPGEEPKHEAKADAAPILSTAAAEWIPVTTGREFNYHTSRNDNPDSVRTQYNCGYVSHQEWLCPAHTGYAKAKATRYWADHGGQRPFPKTADEWVARQGELKQTAEISVKPSKTYKGGWDVVSYKVGEMGPRRPADNRTFAARLAARSRLPDLDSDIPF